MFLFIQRLVEQFRGRFLKLFLFTTRVLVSWVLVSRVLVSFLQNKTRTFCYSTNTLYTLSAVKTEIILFINVVWMHVKDTDWTCTSCWWGVKISCLHYFDSYRYFSDQVLQTKHQCYRLNHLQLYKSFTFIISSTSTSYNIKILSTL